MTKTVPASRVRFCPECGSLQPRHVGHAAFYCDSCRALFRVIQPAIDNQSQK